MKFKIYDYAKEAVEIETLNKPIDHIHVVILSGDETGTIFYEDGTKQVFDASDCRQNSFYDGCYDVAKEDVAWWMAYVPRAQKYDNKAEIRMGAYFTKKGK